MSNICGVIVTYHPELSQLKKLVAVASKQVETLVIVNNGGITDLSLLPGVTKLIEPVGNVGIAAAHNLGIDYAGSIDSTHVLLLDQDSLPEGDMVASLLHHEAELTSQGKKVAALGPSTVDSRTGHADMFIRYDNLNVRRFDPSKEGEAHIRCSFLISSGCLIPMPVIRDVGVMDEALFIDLVDIEWGFRASNKEYELYGVTSAKMYHAVGDEPFIFMGRTLTMHSPLRHYYFFRNFYHILLRRRAPVCWKIHVLIKSSVQACIFSLVAEDRWQQFRMITKGIYHGLIGKLGKYDG